MENQKRGRQPRPTAAEREAIVVSLEGLVRLHEELLPKFEARAASGEAVYHGIAERQRARVADLRARLDAARRMEVAG